MLRFGAEQGLKTNIGRDIRIGGMVLDPGFLALFIELPKHCTH